MRRVLCCVCHKDRSLRARGLMRVCVGARAAVCVCVCVCACVCARRQQHHSRAKCAHAISQHSLKRRVGYKGTQRPYKGTTRMHSLGKDPVEVAGARSESALDIESDVRPMSRADDKAQGGVRCSRGGKGYRASAGNALGLNECGPVEGGARGRGRGRGRGQGRLLGTRLLKGPGKKARIFQDSFLKKAGFRICIQCGVYHHYRAACRGVKA